ncbi:MAG: hypothetical protein WD398_08415 [Cyclobacteriaceae bacterium]
MTILFITWDSDQTNYLENLFFPIFKGITKETGIAIHVMQFSWSGSNEVERIRSIASQQGIKYVHHKVRRKPVPALGAYLTMLMGASKIKAHAKEYGIQVLMPRSTMPAMMVNRLQQWIWENNLKVVFDADGLPIEERVDFAGLKQQSLQYRWLKDTERKMVEKADAVLTRSKKAIALHLDNMGVEHGEKFFCVSNGRDPGKFKPDQACRQKIRRKWGLSDEDFLWVYTGSLGPAYMVNQMLDLFGRFQQIEPGSKFLFLTRNESFLSGKIPVHLESAILIKSVPFEEVPFYLAAADVGLSLRQHAPSLAGLAPIKIGEYLLSGLPVIASPGVGDTEDMLFDQRECFIYSDQNQFDHLLKWISTIKEMDPQAIRALGLQHFDLRQSIREYLKVLETLPST